MYLYSIYDDPETETKASASFQSSNKKQKRDVIEDTMMWEGEGEDEDEDDSDNPDGESSSSDEEMMSSSEDERDTMKTSSTPITMPRRRFTGHCNVETVKDGWFMPLNCALVLILISLFQ